MIDTKALPSGQTPKKAKSAKSPQDEPLPPVGYLCELIKATALPSLIVRNAGAKRDGMIRLKNGDCVTVFNKGRQEHYVRQEVVDRLRRAQVDIWFELKSAKDTSTAEYIKLVNHEPNAFDQELANSLHSALELFQIFANTSWTEGAALRFGAKRLDARSITPDVEKEEEEPLLKRDHGRRQPSSFKKASGCDDDLFPDDDDAFAQYPPPSKPLPADEPLLIGAPALDSALGIQYLETKLPTNEAARRILETFYERVKSGYCITVHEQGEKTVLIKTFKKDDPSVMGQTFIDRRTAEVKNNYGIGL